MVINMVKRKKNLLLIILVALVAIVALLFIAMILGKNYLHNNYLTMGQKYMDELAYDDAIIAYKKAIQMDPKLYDAYNGLAIAYEANGDPLMAAKTLEIAYAKVTNEVYIVDIEKYIEKLINEYTEVQSAVNEGIITLGREITEGYFEDFIEHSVGIDVNQLLERLEKNDIENDVIENNLVKNNIADMEVVEEDVSHNNSGVEELTLYGHHLVEWKYEEVEAFVKENFEYHEQRFFEDGSYTAPYDLPREDGSGASAFIDDSISIHKHNGFSYTIYQDANYKTKWDVEYHVREDNHYRGQDEEAACKILGRYVKEYMESICPGVYEKLEAGGEAIQVEYGTVQMKDNGVIYFSYPDCSLYLRLKNQIIERIEVFLY